MSKKKAEGREHISVEWTEEYVTNCSHKDSCIFIDTIKKEAKKEVFDDKEFDIIRDTNKFKKLMERHLNTNNTEITPKELKARRKELLDYPEKGIKLSALSNENKKEVD